MGVGRFSLMENICGRFTKVFAHQVPRKELRDEPLLFSFIGVTRY